jgi:hypothetical protein
MESSVYRFHCCFIGVFFVLILWLRWFFGTNKLQMFTASLSKPPGFQSKIILSAPCLLSSLMPAWFHRRLFIKMSQHDSLFSHLFSKKYNRFYFDFIKNDLGCIFYPLTQVFHINFRVFSLSSKHRLWSLIKYISYLDDFIPVLNQPYQGKSL